MGTIKRTVRCNRTMSVGSLQPQNARKTLSHSASEPHLRGRCKASIAMEPLPPAQDLGHELASLHAPIARRVAPPCVRPTQSVEARNWSYTVWRQGIAQQKAMQIPRTI